MNKKKLKGFTLIELLAVIVILAIIALIVTPIILNVIEESRDKSNMDSAYGLVDAADLYYTQNSLDGVIAYKTNILDILKVSGKKPDSGYVYLNEDGDVTLGVVYDDICYVKSYTDSEVTKVDDKALCDSPPAERTST